MSDDLKPSRLLLRLEAEIAGARTQLDADCKRAERAAYLARVGRFDEARGEIASLQSRYSEAPRIELSIWMNFAEGVITYFASMGASTTDRIQRAYALSVAGGQERMRGLCAAWLAQWDYLKLDMDALARHVHEALTIADPDDHAVRSRACLVAAQALHLAGRFDLATPWYGKSRFHASIDGDDVTLSALMHNMAWLRMMTMRQAVLRAGQRDADAAVRALSSAVSTESFDQLKGDSSWLHLKPILRAQIASLQGDSTQALALYEQHLATASAPLRLQANLLADKAWCHADLDQRVKAVECATMALIGLSDEAHVDDRAAAHSRLAQVFSVLGNATELERHLKLASLAWGRHIDMQERVVRLLTGIGARGSAP